LGLIAGSGELGQTTVIFGVLLGLFDHALDLFFGQTRTGSDSDLVFFTCALIFGRDVQDTVSVNVKGNLDLWGTTGSRWNALEIEFAQQLVTCGDFALTLEYLDRHSRLVIVCG